MAYEPLKDWMHKQRFYASPKDSMYLINISLYIIQKGGTVWLFWKFHLLVIF